MIAEDNRQAAGKLIHVLIDSGMSIVTAESCTGGLIVAALTEIRGSSESVYGGFITYADEAKANMLGVPETMIAQYGAVSSNVARAMAEGARKTALVDVAIAVTGIAGPGGGTDKKPVGLVHFACATEAGTSLLERRFGAIGRRAIREATVRAALELTLACIVPQND
jgi:nicotinamide-nucleotide amidase